MVSTSQVAHTEDPDASLGAGGTGLAADTPIRSHEPMSVKGPALIVLGLAVVILLGGVTAAALSRSPNPTFSIRQVTLDDGTTVRLVPATVKLHGIVDNSEPPADIIGNLGIPQESMVAGILNRDRHTAQFDRTVTLSSQLAQSQVIETYRRILRGGGWKIIYEGPAPQGRPGATEILAKLGSSDGFYWEVGVVASPTAPTGATRYSVEVLETPDGN